MRGSNTILYLISNELLTLRFLTFFCQLDIVFHFNKVYSLLDEYILAGEIQETSKRVILERVRELEKLD